MGGICNKCCQTGYPDASIGQPCEGCERGVIERDPPRAERVEVLPEAMTCRRRVNQEQGLDRWHRFKSNGDRVCSYCGSLHPDDFFRLVHAAATAGEDATYRDVVSIEPSDKSYKIYVHQPNVRNAMEGGLKFYKQHLARNQDGSLDLTSEQDDEYRKAVFQSQLRFNEHLKRIQG
jgi:hypothetical protein